MENGKNHSNEPDIPRGFDDLDITAFSEPTVETMNLLFDKIKALKDASKVVVSHNQENGVEQEFKQFHLSRRDDEASFEFSAAEAPAVWLEEYIVLAQEAHMAANLVYIKYHRKKHLLIEFSQDYMGDPELYVKDEQVVDTLPNQPNQTQERLEAARHKLDIPTESSVRTLLEIIDRYIS